MIEFYGGYQVYSESGVDLTLLRENLRRSLEERWENNRGVAAFVWVVDQASRAARGLPHRPEPEAPLFDPAAVLRHLLDAKAEFVVVGGLAMTMHGSAYVTRDLDLCYRGTETNIAALVAALAPFHPSVRGPSPEAPFHFDAVALQRIPHFPLTTDLGDLDLLAEIPGIGPYEQVLMQSEERTLFGLTVRILSLDGLILAKKAVGRRKDQVHLLELEELKKLKDASPES